MRIGKNRGNAVPLHMNVEQLLSMANVGLIRVHLPYLLYKGLKMRFHVGKGSLPSQTYICFAEKIHWISMVVAASVVVFVYFRPDSNYRLKSLSGYSASYHHQYYGGCNNGSALRVSVLENMTQPSSEQLMDLALLTTEKGTWVQIGANTMDNRNGNDPLKLHLSRIPGWTKFFVEPVPSLFEQLAQSIVQWPNSTAINVALSADETVAESHVDIYCLAESLDANKMETTLPHWANQICSFNPNHITKHFPDKKGVAVPVVALSFRELLRRYDIHEIDVLMVDTEGFDYHVLKQVPFEGLRPILIVYEHKHMVMEERRAAESLLRRNCYAVWKLDGENTAALALNI